MTDKTMKVFSIGLLVSLGFAIRLTALVFAYGGGIVNINYPHGYDPVLEITVNFMVIFGFTLIPTLIVTSISWVKDIIHPERWLSE